MLYQQIDLSTGSLVGEPGPVPAALAPFPPEVLADPSATCNPPPSDLVGRGWWPVLRGPVTYDGATQVLDGTTSLKADPATKTVVEIQNVRAMTADELAAVLTSAKAAKVLQVGVKLAAVLATGAPVAGGLHVSVSDASRADLSGMATTALAAASNALPWPDSYKSGWIAIENVRIPLTSPVDGLKLAAGVGDYYAQCCQHGRDLKDAVLAAKDQATLAAVDLAAGWP